MEAEKARCSLGVFRQKWIRLCDNSDTPAQSAPENHNPVDREEHGVDWDTQEIPEKVWSTRVFTREQEKEKIIYSKTDVVNHLVNILEAVIDGLGLRSVLSVMVQRMVAGIECDILLVYGSNLIPLGAIEVNKPHGVEDDNMIFAATANRVAGQNLDQLRNLTIMMGLKKCFGMITTGNLFMLTSTHRIDGRCPSIPTQGQVSQSDISPERVVDSSRGTDRMDVLHTSLLLNPGIDATHSEHVIKMFVRFVINSYDQISTINFKTPIAGTVYARKLEVPENGGKPTTFVHAFQTIQTAEINRSDYITPNTSNIFLVRYLGRGSCGDCCFAVSNNGNTCCAVKFYVDKLDSEELAKNELKNWNSVYCGTKLPQCRIGYVADTRAYLAMPYLSPVSREKRKYVLENEIKVALQDFSRKQENGKRYLHADVKWRHFGYYQNKLYLLDLGYVSEVKNGDAKVKALIEASFKSLRTNMGTTDVGTVDAAGKPQGVLKRRYGSPGAAAPRASNRKRHGGTT
jgi:hypothetical protein